MVTKRDWPKHVAGIYYVYKTLLYVYMHLLVLLPQINIFSRLFSLSACCLLLFFCFVCIFFLPPAACSVL